MNGTDRDARSGMDRLRRLTWWSSAGVVWVIGGAAIVSVLLAQVPGWESVSAVGAIVAGCWAASLLFSAALPGASATSVLVPSRVLVLVVSITAVAAAWLLPPLVSWWPVVAAIIASALIVRTPPHRRALVAGLVTLVVPAVGGLGLWWRGEELEKILVTSLPGALVVLGFGFAVVAQLWVLELAGQLDVLRQKAAGLAVAEERLRFAGELHDIQGQHLQVIALKSELGARLARSDPEEARMHMDEVHELAQTALRDTRAVVHGYRRISLRQELANATRVLEAAGIDCRMQHSDMATEERLSETPRSLLALVVREATTNILRHSSAREARLRLAVAPDVAELTVENDLAQPRSDAPGSGLAGLAERLEAHGGALRWTLDDGRFTVIATVPIADRSGGR